MNSKLKCPYYSVYKKAISYILMLCVALSLIVTMPVKVDANTEGDYEYTVSEGKATITGCSKEIEGEIEIPSTLGGYPVTHISGMAFFNCNKITGVTIPNGIVHIATLAFYNCTSLKEVNIPDSLECIDSHAFAGTAWYDDQPDGLIYLGRILYSYKEKMPSDCSVDIKNGTICITGEAFADLTNLVSVKIPSTLKKIGNGAFRGCTGLRSVDIPDSVISIGASAFSGCTGLTSIVIPDGVESIGSYAFSACDNITDVTIADSVFDIGSYAFENTAWYENQPTGAVYIGKVFYKYKGTIPTGITFDIKNGTKGIAEEAFYGSSISGINIPNTVKWIGCRSFYYCENLETISFPHSVEYIDSSAFMFCRNLREVIFYGRNTSIIGSYAFQDCESIKINGYRGSSVEVYASDNGYTFIPLDEIFIANGSAELKNNDLIVSVDIGKKANNEILIVGLYDKNNRMINCKQINLSQFPDVSEVVFNDVSDISFAKIFLWDSMTSLKPCTASRSIDITE